MRVIKRSRVKYILRTYWANTLEHPWLFLSITLATLGMQAAALTSPLYLRQFFNLLATHSPDAATIHQLLVIVGIIALISAFDWMARRTHVFSLIYLESKIMVDLYVKAFDYLIGHSYQFFVSQFTGTLTRRVSKFATAYETVLDGIMMQFFPTVLFITGVVVVLFLRNHTLGIILGIWVIIFVAFQVLIARRLQPLRVARAEEDSKANGTLADAISNQTTISLFAGAKHEHGLFAKAIHRWYEATIRSWKFNEVIWSVQGVLMVSINLGLLYGAIIFWKQGLLTIGDFVLIQTYLLGTFDRLTIINREFRRLYDAFADAGEMAEILDTPHDIRNIAGAQPLKTHGCEIAFKNVNFHFLKDYPVLDKFNLTIQSGEKLAFVGPSGAGKSTVTKLLLRMYDILSGSIEIDGQNIAAVTQESLRNTIAFVPQEPILFHRSLVENIRYGRRDATDKEIIEASKRAHCHEFISQLPEGYETFVGERGVKLSGGERQRVAIARAILKNAPILVLDEATSSLDSQSEALIQDALQTLMQGKTVVVIAHRLSTIMKMDRIVVLEKGRIVAEGSHNKLLEQTGLYQKLWNIQAGGFLSENSAGNIIEKESKAEDEKEVSDEPELKDKNEK